ncbi:hypothetical protein F5Y19DRAFT_469235 [Xylariaceae sp. FL1651]|nr:hypothetical protein F5Y19DRAFT_469235 [Xylariaceae sp. FL1651]
MAALIPVPELHAKLDAFWVAVQALQPDSSDAEYAHMASFLAPDAELFFSGVNQPAAHGREGAAQQMRQMTAYWRLEERRVRSRAASADGRTLVAEMCNALRIRGEPVELKELEIVEFDGKGEGLIVSYRLYVDASPVREALARAAGKGTSSA